MERKKFSLRIDKDTLFKLHIVSDDEGRSANSHIIMLIRSCIDDFEREHGRITIQKENHPGGPG